MIRYFNIIYFCLLAFTVMIAGMSAPDEAQAFSLQDLIKYAAENNPRLKAARLEWARVIQKYPQATSYDDPMLAYTYPIEKIETRLGPQEHILMLNQKFPFPGRLGLQGDVIAEEVEIARTLYEKEVRNVIVAVKKSYYELYYIDNAIRLTEQNKKILEHLTNISTNESVEKASFRNVLALS